MAVVTTAGGRGRMERERAGIPPARPPAHLVWRVS